MDRNLCLGSHRVPLDLLGHLQERGPGFSESQTMAAMASRRFRSSVLKLCGLTKVAKEEAAVFCELSSDSKGKSQDRKANFLKISASNETLEPKLIQ